MALPAWSAQPAQALRADGTPVPLQVYEPSAAPCLPLAVVSHGAGGSETGYAYLGEGLQALGWRVALNQPYAGGWTTQRWGRPSEGFHAIQIELNRALYFDEPSRTPGPGWSRTEKGVARVIADLLAGA